MGTQKQGCDAIGVARNILRLLLDEMRAFNLRGTPKIVLARSNVGIILRKQIIPAEAVFLIYTSVCIGNN